MCPLDEEVGQLWDGHIRLVGAVQEICNKGTIVTNTKLGNSLKCYSNM